VQTTKRTRMYGPSVAGSSVSKLLCRKSLGAVDVTLGVRLRVDLSAVTAGSAPEPCSVPMPFASAGLRHTCELPKDIPTASPVSSKWSQGRGPSGVISPPKGMLAYAGAPGFAMEDFDGTRYGPECLSLVVGAPLVKSRISDLDPRWAYGSRLLSGVVAEGWFPASLWVPTCTQIQGKGQDSLVSRTGASQVSDGLSGMVPTVEQQPPSGVVVDRPGMCSREAGSPKKGDALRNQPRSDATWDVSTNIASLPSDDSKVSGVPRNGWVVPCRGHLGVALANFDSAQYGDEYVSLKAGDLLHKYYVWDQDARWAYGRCTSNESNGHGWFPAEFWRPISERGR